MTDFMTTTNPAFYPWNDTQTKVYAPYAENFDFVAGLKDPSRCPEANLVSVINQLKDKDAIIFFNTFSADQQRDILPKLDAKTLDTILQTTNRAKLLCALSQLQMLELAQKIDSPETHFLILDALTQERRTTYYKSLSDNITATLFKVADEDKKKMLIQLAFKPNTFAHEFFSKNPLSSLEGANSWLNKIAYSTTDKSIDWKLSLRANSAQIKAFNEKEKCSRQDVANKICKLTQLTQLDIHCSESSQTSGWPLYSLFFPAAPLPQFEAGKPHACTITLTGTEKELTKSFTFPKDTKEFRAFSRYNLPSLNADGSPITDDKKLSLYNLKNLASSAEGSPATSFAATLNVTAVPTNAAFGIFEPEHKFSGYFDENNIQSKAEDITLTTVCKDDVSHIGRRTQCDFSLSGVASDFFQSLTYTIEESGKVVLGATNSTTTTNWVNLLNKVDEHCETFEDNPLVLQLAKGNGATESPSSSFFRNMGTIQRASDLAIFNILPAIAAGTAVYHSVKFIQSAINHPKKTTGQKIAGTFIGGAGILAGIALAYNRLNQINLGLV